METLFNEVYRLPSFREDFIIPEIARANPSSTKMKVVTGLAVVGLITIVILWRRDKKKTEKLNNN